MIFNHELSPAQERNLERRARAAACVDRTEPDPRHLRAARAARTKASCRSSSRSSSIWRRAWCAAGPTSSARRAASACRRPGRDAARDRPALHRRAREGAEGASSRSCRRSARVQRARARARRGAARSRSSATPTPASRRCSTRSRTPGAYAADQLFATLDTTTRRVCLRRAGSDRALGHGRASSATCRTRWSPRSARRSRRRCTPICCCTWSTRVSPARDAQIEAVNAVLAEIGADAIPQLLVWNKIDRDAGVAPGVERDEYGKISRVSVSARTGAGLDRSARRASPRRAAAQDRARRRATNPIRH